MWTIGITGGIGSGKSTVAEYFAARGCQVLDADQISRELTLPGGAAEAEVIEAFGPAIRDAAGAIDRKKLADVVFSDRQALDQLSLIVHAHVMEALKKDYQEALKRDQKILVLDVPIPVEDGFLNISDQVLVIWADDEKRLARLLVRGLSRDDALERMRMQMTKEEYEALGDVLIDNSGSRAELYEQLDAYVESELMPRGLRLPLSSELERRDDD